MTREDVEAWAQAREAEPAMPDEFLELFVPGPLEEEEGEP